MTNQWIQDYFKSRDGVKIFYRFYALPGARHTVIMLHGYGEHSGRYEKFPTKMGRLSAQFAVMDFRGMGRSGGARGDIGTFDDYLGDVTAFIDHLRKRHSIPSKFILFGHSLGGLVATCWAMKNPEPVKLLILSAPFLGLRFSGVIRPLNRLMQIFAPGFIYKNPVRSRSLSHDPVEVAIYRKDPLILRHISARLIGEITRLIEALRKQPILSVPFPVYLLAVGEEQIVDPAMVRKFFERLVAPRKERTIFEGFFHELFNEREQQRAFNVLKTIIEDCV
ncbi:MAG: lysophospholipase [Candidatus Omnitrophica bacterium]|nr:lysophospholipase [Candidatus Omnitrophota bacterium]